MISVEQALEIILSTTKPAATETSNICNINNRVLSKDITAIREQPPFNRVSMDGIAINTKFKSNTEFKIEGIQAAGSEQMTLKDQNNCIEVMTGATLPLGTNCVIRYEDIQIKDEVVTILKDLDLFKNKNIHMMGSDYKSEEILITSGTRVNSTHIAIIASQGKSEVEVYKTPKIAIISTGDELVELDKPIKDHQIFLSNSYAMRSLLVEFGITDISRHHIKDDQGSTKNKIEELLNQNDMLIISGGVSMGKFDFIPKALSELGVTNHFHKIKQKPGKPMWYGTTEIGKQVFALPGNPVSCTVCLRRYTIPAILKSLGYLQKSFKVKLAEKVIFKKEMTLFKPVCLEIKNSELLVHPLKINGSGDFNSLGTTSGFIELPSDQDEYIAGESYPYYSWTNN
jgi:molybdopterin molybdotransferase